MTYKRLCKILAKRPNWGALKVILEEYISEEGHDGGRYLVVNTDYIGPVQVRDCGHNLYTAFLKN